MRNRPLQGRQTTPIVNFARKGFDLEGYSEEYSQVCSTYHEAGIPPVAFLKERLGKQDYCFIDARRGDD